MTDGAMVAGRPQRSGLRRFLRGSSFFFAARVLGAGVAFAVHLLLARWMGTAELGYYVAAFSWCLILTRFATLGFGHASLRFLAEGQANADPGTIRGYVGRTRRLVLGAGLVFGAITALVMALFAAPGDPGVAVNRVAVLATPLLAWIGVQSGYSIALSWPRLAMLNNLLRPAGLLVGVTIAWAAGGTLTALKVIWIHAGVMLLVAGIQQLFFERVFAREIARAPVRHDTRTWLATSLPLMLVTLYGSLFFEYNVIFLAAALPAAAIGVFSVAYKIAFLLHFVKWAVDSASLPQISRLYRGSADRSLLQQELTNATRLQTAVTALGALGIVALGRPVLALVGAGFEAGYLVMVLLAAALVARAALGPCAELLGITGHQKTSLAACAAGLLAAPPLLLLLVPPYGLVGAGLTIVLISTAISYWLHRQVWRRLGLQASVFGSDTLLLRVRRWLGRTDTRKDPRRSRIQVCGPDVVRKSSRGFLGEEFAKAGAMWEAARDGSFVTPRPLRLDEAAATLEVEYLAFDGTAKELYLDYMKAEELPADHPLPALIDAAGRALARMHRSLRLPGGAPWRAREGFLKDLARCGFDARALAALPTVPLHCDFCLDNVAYRDNGAGPVPVVLDPSPDFVSTFHPHTHGPAYVDLSQFLTCLEGRVPLRHYRKLRWDRVPALKERFLRAYNAHAEHPVDGRLAEAFAFCLARQYCRVRFAVKPLAHGASWLLYNGFKRNDPRRAAHA